MNIVWNPDSLLTWGQYEMLCTAFGLEVRFNETYLDKFVNYGYIYKKGDDWCTSTLTEEQKTMLWI